MTKALCNHLSRDQFNFQILSNPALQPTDLIKAILLKLGDTNSDNGSINRLPMETAAELVEASRGGR